MTVLLLLFAAVGGIPLALGLTLAMWRAGRLGLARRVPLLSSVLLCALTFNLVFFWQELWLVIPKALTPGLHPTLFHNDHGWTGDAPTVELLQGSGALATLAIGLIFITLLATMQHLGATIRLFFFWMAFQGLSQALTQFAVGSVLPGNDVGRALTYLGLRPSGHIALEIATAIALALSGNILARLFPTSASGSRVETNAGIRIILFAAILSIPLIVPFRIPRNPIETTLIPAIVNVIGAGWMTLGFAVAPKDLPTADPVRARVALPGLCLVALLLIFQLILRPGISF